MHMNSRGSMGMCTDSAISMSAVTKIAESFEDKLCDQVHNYLPLNSVPLLLHSEKHSC